MGEMDQLQNRMDIAHRAVSAGDSETALREARCLLKEYGNRPTVRFNCAGLLIDAGERLEDRDSVNQGITILRELQNSPEQAQKFASDLRYNLANGLASLVHMESRKRLSPDYCVRDLEREEEVVRLYYDASNRLSSERPEVSINCASMLRVEGRLYEAIDLLDSVLVHHPSSGGSRVLKSATDGSSNERHTVYVFDSLELHQTEFEGVGSAADFALDPLTETVRLPGGITARVVYSQEELPGEPASDLHVFLMVSDHLGSNAFIIDRDTSELVEYSTFEAYGSIESDYRPQRWSSEREPYKFSGKEEDVEVGLVYFGARYLNAGLQIWMSPDPVAIHQFGSDPNPYAYVHGRPLVAVDPDGRFAFFVAAQLVSTMAANYAVLGAPNFIAQVAQPGVGVGDVDWGLSGVTGSVLAANAAAGVTMGTGAVLGPALVGLGSVGGSAATGAVAGATGSSTGYLAGAAFGQYDFSGQGFALSVGIGAGIGAAGGMLSGALKVRAESIAGAKAKAQAGGAAAHQGSAAPGAQANAEGAGSASARVSHQGSSSPYFYRTRIAENAERAFLDGGSYAPGDVVPAH